MKILVILSAVSLLLVTFFNVQKEKEQTTAPMMVAFSELKWTELPERPGMQFAILSGDPKTGAYTQMRKVPEKKQLALIVQAIKRFLRVVSL